MPLSDQEFDEELQQIAEHTVTVINSGDEVDAFILTVFLSFPDRLMIEVLAPEPGNRDAPDVYELLRDFGRMSRHRTAGDLHAVFVAGEVESEEDEEVSIVGMTPDGRINVAHVPLARRDDGTIRALPPRVIGVESDIEFRGRNAAEKFLEGWHDVEPRRRWWQWLRRG